MRLQLRDNTRARRSSRTARFFQLSTCVTSVVTLTPGCTTRLLGNRTPTAVIVADAQSRVGIAVLFDGSRSSDSDGVIQHYRWDFGDGTSADGPLIEHMFQNPGEFVVTLTVTDNDGSTAVAAISVQITPELFSLHVVIEPPAAGLVDLEPPGGLYEDGTAVTLTAQPEDGFVFAAFEGAAAVDQPQVQLIMDADKEVTARFAAEAVVSVAVQPTGSGEVALDPPGGAYAAGTSVTLTATAFAGFTFDAFADGAGVILSSQPALTIIASEHVAVIARFRADDSSHPFTLDIDVSPPGGGAVSVSPPGSSYSEGTVVTLTAEPNDGYHFIEYSGDANGNDPVTVVTMTGDKRVAAEFGWVPARGNPGNLLVTGFLGANVREFDRFGGDDLGEFVAEGAGGISFAGGIDVGPSGDIFVVDVGVLSDTRVLRFDKTSGELVEEFVTGPGGTGFLTLRFGPNGNLFLPNSSNSSIGEYDGATGDFLRTFVAAGSGGLDNPVGLTFGPNGNLFVVSKDNDRILEFDGTTGAPRAVTVDLAGAGFTVPVDLVFGPDGALYVSVSGDESVVRVDTGSGKASAFVMSESGGMDSPAGLVVHPDTGNLLVVSQGTNEVLEYDGVTGAFVGVFAEGVEGDSLFFTVIRFD